MSNLNDLFIEYNDNIRLKKSDYDKMTEKRDKIIEELKEDENLMSFTVINLGSYKLRTGVKYKDNDYDIDCGIRLNIPVDKLKQYDPNECKNSVYDAIKGHRDKKFKHKCLTAIYKKDDHPNFHIDFPVFAYDSDKNKYYLADGLKDNVEWIESKPSDLIEYLNLNNDDYKRIVRILKKWNNKAFANEKKHAKAPSIALTIEACDWFNNNKYSNDLDTLIDIVNNIKNLIDEKSIYKKNPFSNDNLYYKMDDDEECVEIFSEKIVYLLNILNEAKELEESSLYECAKKLRKVFPDFPEPEKEEASRSFSSSAKYA